MHLRHSVTHDLNMKAGIVHRGEARGACFFGLALAFGRGATGLTFYDDDTTKFFEPHAKGKSPLLMVAIGVPRSKRSDS